MNHATHNASSSRPDPRRHDDRALARDPAIWVWAFVALLALLPLKKVLVRQAEAMRQITQTAPSSPSDVSVRAREASEARPAPLAHRNDRRPDPAKQGEGQDERQG